MKTTEMDDVLPFLVPCDLLAERGLLGCLLVDPDCDAGVAADRFYLAKHQKLYSVIEIMKAEGRIDPLLVAGRLTQLEIYDECGGPPYLQALVDGAADRSQAADCAERVNEAWRRRVFYERTQHAAMLACDPNVDWDELAGEIDLPEVIDGGRRPRFQSIGGRELDGGAFEQRFLIPGVLVAGQAGGVYGAFKTLKTSCTADLLLSVATGQPFLGHFPVAEPGPVMFLSGESGMGAMQSIARRICAARGLSLNQVDGFELSTDLPRFDNAADVIVLRNMIMRRGLKVLAIDPAYLAIDVSDNARNLFAVGPFWKPVGRLCEATGCTVLVVHHCRRDAPDPLRPATLADVAWGGFAEFSAQWLLLSRRVPFDAERGRHELWASFGGRAGHSGLWALDTDEGKLENSDGRQWQVTVRSATAARRAALEDIDRRREVRRERKISTTLGRDQARVIRALALTHGGETARCLRERLSFTRTAV